MDLKIVGKCFTEQGSDLFVDLAGNRIPAKSVIFCKKGPFIVIKDGDIDKFAAEEMDVIYQATDEDLNFFEAQVKELDTERNQSIITSIFRTLTGTRHKMRRRQVTSIPNNTDNSGCSKPYSLPNCGSNPRHTCDHNDPSPGSSGYNISPQYPNNGRTGIVSTRNPPASDNS